jgi:transcription initiation factor TFIIIB Brf1 subunit/transcription initiation factor TFIIB
VCMDCGVVLDENLLGGEEYLGPGIIRERGGGKETLCHRSTAAKREEWEGGERGWTGKEKIFHILSKFHLDTQEVGEKVWDKYEKIYEGRRRRNELHGSENREKVALVFAISTVLNEERIPRPIAHIADLCGLPSHHLRRVLKIRDSLNLGKGVTSDYSDGRAEDYVNAVCAHLGISFSVGQQAERMLDRREIKWALFGHRPHLLAASVIECVLRARGKKSRITDLCRELKCGESSVKRIMAKIPPNLCHE